ncbi:MAG TPA: hypothetical protein DD473_20885 [Planctomycetaceae bacterium]|nr:hypothetical protein [Planctomycetaceae bacterium]
MAAFLRWCRVNGWLATAAFLLSDPVLFGQIHFTAATVGLKPLFELSLTEFCDSFQERLPIHFMSEVRFRSICIYFETKRAFHV